MNYENTCLKFHSLSRELKILMAEMGLEKEEPKILKHIGSGKLTWIENIKVLITTKLLQQKVEWLNEFKKLINFKAFENKSITEEVLSGLIAEEVLPLFSNLKEIDCKDKIGITFISDYFKQILFQPHFYLSNVRRRNGGELKSDFCELQILQGWTGRVNYHFKMLVNDFFEELKLLIKEEPSLAERIVSEIVLLTEDFLQHIEVNNCKYFFVVERSPLFCAYMRFVGDLQSYFDFFGRSVELPCIGKYLKHLGLYSKIFFDDSTMGYSIPTKKFDSLPEMFGDHFSILYKIDQELIKQGIAYRNIDGKMIWEGHPFEPRGENLQLAAFAELCKPFFKKAYKDVERGKAFMDYYYVGSSLTPFKASEYPNAMKYEKRFEFVKKYYNEGAGQIGHKVN